MDNSKSKWKLKEKAKILESVKFCNVTGRSLCFTMVARKKRLLRLPDSFFRFSFITKGMARSLEKARRNMWLHFSERNLSPLIRANLFGERNSAHSDISAPLAWPFHPPKTMSVLLQWKHFKVLTWPLLTLQGQTQVKTQFSSHNFDHACNWGVSIRACPQVELTLLILKGRQYINTDWGNKSP